MKKRLLSLLLALVLVLGAMPFTALADGASIVAQGTCGDQGDNVTWVLTDDGVLTISGTGAMADYASGGAPWMEHSAQIKGGVIEEGITYIGSYAFAIAGMESISISNTVTKIGSNSFRKSGIKSLVLPNSVTSIGGNAFRQCNALVELELPASITELGGNEFRECTGLKSVKIHCALISTSMFNSCSALTDVQMDENVKSVGNSAFAFCTSLKEITFPDSVTSIGTGVFSYDTALLKVTLPAGLTEIPIQLFAYDAALKTVSVDFSKITKVGNAAFTGCTAFDANVNFTDTLTTLEYSAFANSGIKSVNLPGTIKTLDGDTFRGCGSLVTVTLNEGLEVIKSDAFKDCISLTSINLPSTLTTIEDYRAFQNCLELTEITLPKNLTYLGHSAFSGCAGLKTVTIYDKLTTIGNQAFNGCTALETVNFHGTEEQWQAIEIRSDNDPLLAANVVFRTFADEKPVVKAENVKSSGKIKLTIEPVEDAVSYKIFVATTADGEYKLAKESTALTYTYSGKAGTKYYFKVVAVNEAGAESAESDAVSKVQLPAQVTSLKATSKKGQVTLKWKKVTGAKKYEIYMSKNGKTGWKKVGSATKNTFIYKKGKVGQKLYFKVRAVTSNGKKGEFSKVVSVKVKK